MLMKSLGWGLTGGISLGIVYGLVAFWFLSLSIGLLAGLIATFVALLALIFVDIVKKKNDTIKFSSKFFILLILGTLLGAYFSHFGACSGESCGYAHLFFFMIIGAVFILGIMVLFIVEMILHFKEKGNSQEKQISVEEEKNEAYAWFTGAIILILAIILAVIWFLNLGGLDNCISISHQYGEQCYNRMVEKARDPSLCDETKNLDMKEICYSEVSGLTGDYSLCEKLTLSSYKNNCYINAYKSKKDDPLLCEKVSDTAERQKCYYLVAVTTGDPKYCEMSKDYDVAYMADDCYTKIAEMKKDPSYCEKAKYPHWCYAFYAGVTKDSSVCERIQYPDTKNQCYDSSK